MEGKCWKFGDNISTDEIISTRYMTLTDQTELGSHLFEGIRPGMAGEVREGDVILAGNNIGYGSSREHAPLALLGAGIRAIIARSFARIFYRNCINLGIAVITSDEAVNASDEGDVLHVDVVKGEIVNKTKGRVFHFAPFPDSVLAYIEKGGLINALNEERKHHNGNER